MCPLRLAPWLLVAPASEPLSVPVKVPVPRWPCLRSPPDTSPWFLSAIEFLYPCIIVYIARGKVNAFRNSRNCTSSHSFRQSPGGCPPPASFLSACHHLPSVCARQAYLRANFKAAPIGRKPTPQVTHAIKPPLCLCLILTTERGAFNTFCKLSSHIYVR